MERCRDGICSSFSSGAATGCGTSADETERGATGGGSVRASSLPRATSWRWAARSCTTGEGPRRRSGPRVVGQRDPEEDDEEDGGDEGLRRNALELHQVDEDEEPEQRGGTHRRGEDGPWPEDLGRWGRKKVHAPKASAYSRPVPRVLRPGVSGPVRSGSPPARLHPLDQHGDAHSVADAPVSY